MGIKTPWNLTLRVDCVSQVALVYTAEVTSQYRIQNGFGCIYQLLSNSKDSMFFSQSGDNMGSNISITRK